MIDTAEVVSMKPLDVHVRHTLVEFSCREAVVGEAVVKDGVLVVIDTAEVISMELLYAHVKHTLVEFSCVDVVVGEAVFNG